MSHYEKLHLDPGETVIMEVRKHWIVFVGQILAFIFSVLSLPILHFLLAKFVPFLANFVNNNIEVFTFFYVVWILIFWISFFIQWTKYFLDVWYVTETRIIDIEQKRLFHREVSNLRFDKIQDVTIEVGGLIATFLHYGSIKVQTASENSQSFFMSHVKNPEYVKKIIFGQHNDVGDAEVGIV